ncbi:hypothetical protein C6497_08525 [Candidatus Poribacteria bacterium]|nr:MAG: hypothetical protein C6497_08525 [Candidatus Poribacteria bacterium]
MKGGQMTEERKEELRQLLNEAIASLEIRHSWAQETPLLPLAVYRNHLQQGWNYRGPSVINFTPYIVREATKLKFLDFIREELSEYIHENHIQSACSFVAIGGRVPGYDLYDLLVQLLRITIARGIESAVLAFDRCTTETHGSFQYYAVLEGIKLECEIQVYEGIRLVPLPEKESDLPRHLLNHIFSMWNAKADDFAGKTLFKIDATVSPIFCKPFLKSEVSFSEYLSRFQVKVDNNTFSRFDVDDFYGKFCRALSLVCDSAVQIARQWPFLEADKLFNLGVFGVTRVRYPSHSPFGIPNPLSTLQIDEAKRLYEILVNLDSGVEEKLQIPINRWIKSKRSRDPEDKMIDLGIAFESLFLPSDNVDQLAFQFRLRASWLLGEDKAEREKLMDEFKAIYTLRSKAVHNGVVPKKIKVRKDEKPIATSEFIPRAQDLCRQSILKILEDGKFPDWNNLILGEEST